MGKPHYSAGFRLALHEDALSLPFRWRSSRLIFVNSMSDLFQQDVSLGFIQKVFAVMTACPQHTFQILTKRPEIAAQFAGELNRITSGLGRASRAMRCLAESAIFGRFLRLFGSFRLNRCWARFRVCHSPASIG
jgi:protein gp37